MNATTDRLVIDSIAAHYDAPGDWTYFLVRLVDGRTAVVWYGAELPWTSTEGGVGEITCPIDDHADSDHTGGHVFASYEEAIVCYENLVDSIACYES